MGKKEKPYQKYVGTKFGKLTILEIKAGSYIAGKRIVRTKARCKCDCGFIKDINWDHLKSGAINSCGCSRDSNVYIGQKFGNFIVLEISSLKFLHFFHMRK